MSVPPPRRSARHRMWGAWLALPEILRLAAVIVAVFLCAVVAGVLTG